MKTLSAKVISIRDGKTAIVETVRTIAHPIYRKLLTRHKRYHVDTNGLNPKVDEEVIIIECRPLSKHKYFKIKEIKK